MAQRLPIDPWLLGYWGFDEANAGDPALDETGNTDLVVTDAPAVIPARVGNGRQFDGAVTLAAATDSSVFLQWGKGTVIVWITLDSVNQVGDQLRPIVTLEGAGATANDDTALGLYVASDGSLVHRYTAADRSPVEFRTAPGLIRVGRYYSVALVQDIAPVDKSGGGGVVSDLYVNNVPVAHRTGPPPAGTGANVQLRVGGSLKTASRWHGVIDELSIHKVARPYNPYLRGAYFRLTLDATFSQLTNLGNIRTVGTVEMGGGTRWWCYERDGSLYVIRENSLGLFSPEVQLVTSGIQANGAPLPGGAEQPRLSYDPVQNQLLIAFVSAGRVYKLTATGEDAPATLNMPLTQDTAGIVKVTDTVEPERISAGEMSTQGEVGRDTPADAAPSAQVGFIDIPEFGVYVSGPSGYGYNLYRQSGGATVLYAAIPATTPRQTARWPARGLYWFVPIRDRVAGAQYFALPRLSSGLPGKAGSNVVTDFLGQWFTTGADPTYVRFGAPWGAPTEKDLLGGAGETAQDRMLQGVTLTMRSPVKVGASPDATIASAGSSSDVFPDGWGFIARTPVKIGAAPDSETVSAGGGMGVTIRHSSGARWDP